MGKLKAWWRGTAPTAKWVIGAFLVFFVVVSVSEVITRLNESDPPRPVSVKAARGSACFSLGSAKWAERYAFDANDFSDWGEQQLDSTGGRRAQAEGDSARRFSANAFADASERWETLREMAKEKGVSLGDTSDRLQWCQQNELQSYNDGLGE